ncbi:MAG TPA: hypothetical protein VF657_10265 [Actinoplanes sp.]|jgi:hypothetical protein
MSAAAGAMSEGEFRDTLARAEKLIDEVNANVATLFDRADRAMRLLPPGLSHTLADTLVALRDLIARFFEEYAKIVHNPGWPFGLMAAADDWTSRIGGPISQLSAQLSPDQMRTDNHWRGRAADAYAAVLPSQQKAIDAIKATTDAIDTNLTKTAYGIFALWAGVILALVGFVAELAVEAGAAATVVGAPPAAAGAGLSTAKVIGLVVACVALFVTFVGTIVDSVTTLNQSLHSDTAFPGGAWPRSTTTDFDDGSLSDGDTTDWRIKSDD